MRPIVSVARPAPAAHRISYDPAAKPKSDLYRDLLPLITGAASTFCTSRACWLSCVERRPAESNQKSVYTEGQRQTQAAGHLNPARRARHTPRAPTTTWPRWPAAATATTARWPGSRTRRTRHRRAGVAAGEVRLPPDGGDSFRALVGRRQLHRAHRRCCGAAVPGWLPPCPPRNWVEQFAGGERRLAEILRRGILGKAIRPRLCRIAVTDVHQHHHGVGIAGPTDRPRRQ